MAAGRTAGVASRWLRRGGGTALPGLVALNIAPDLLARLARQLESGSVVITGTNGKTTTARMVAACLRAASRRPLANPTGSNMLRGLTSSLMAQADWRGRLRVAGEGAIGVFEVDEATLPHAVAAVAPHVIAITNLLRDQLDRYGEIDRIWEVWRQTVAALPPTTTLVLNADDPSLARLGALATTPVVYFGLDDARWSRPAAAGLDHTADATRCLTCDRDYDYELAFYSHFGHYRCPGCGFARPTPHVAATLVEPRAAGAMRLRTLTPNGGIEVTLGLPSLYNAYNALAAIAVGVALNLPASAIARGLESVTAAFGRQESLVVEGKVLRLALAKNPTGLNQVLRTILDGGGAPTIVFALNDLIADGRDVSWIWDVDFEMLAGRSGAAIASGRRAEDMALRLKYAGVGGVAVEREPSRALRRALAASGDQVYVVPTYTAMLETRAVLTRWGYLSRYWEMA